MTFASVKVSAFATLKAINRKPGTEEEIIHHDPKEEKEDSLRKSGRSHSSAADLETPEGKVKAILPKCEIDSSSAEGLKPENVEGRLTFDNVKFAHPTWPGQQILHDFLIDIAPGKTVAFVGPRHVAVFAVGLAPFPFGIA